jgi:hypothetical protein
LLGVVSGRRRQGKSFLLEALTSVTGGLYFPSLEETEAVSLRTFSTARDLLSASHDTSDCVLACYSATGFHDDLRTAQDPRLALITLDDIYA